MDEGNGLQKFLAAVLPGVLMFVIRLVETFAVSMVTSVFCIAVIFFAPTERAWSFMSIVAFIVTAAAYWYLWNDFAMSRMNKKEYYIVNGLVQLVYFAVSALGYFYLLGYLVYTLAFANLRMFEAFGATTLESVIVVNVLYLVLLIVCERCSRKKIAKVLEEIGMEAADRVEIKDRFKNIIPTRSNKKVEILSVEEIEREMERDEEDSRRAAMEAEKTSELWSGDISKGRGETVERVEYTGEEEPEELAVPENANKDYGADSLWNRDIYAGRTEDGMPLTDYDEEEKVMPPPPAAEPETDLFSGMYRGDGEKADRIDAYDAEETEKGPDAFPYGPESLWNSGFYRGRDSRAVPEHTLDLDDTVSPGDAFTSAAENPNEDYEEGGLWDKSMRQGR